MAEMVGGALLSGFLNVVKKLMAKLLKELETTLLSADVLLNDAKEKQLKQPNVKKWLDELKEVLYEADRVIDKINTEALCIKLEKGESGSKACKCLNFIPKMFSSFDHTVKSEIEETHSRRKVLLDQTELLGLKRVEQKTPWHRLDAPLVEECDVFGRQDDKEAIIKLVLSDDAGDHRISVIPIVGMGGIGKTTLAQLVYNDSRVQEHFDLKAWVTVSEDLDVFKITKVILENMSLTICEDDCWQLFAKHVFNDMDSDVKSTLLDIGKQIVKKCKGLPLAVKSMAGLLRSTLNEKEWRWILDSDIWELQYKENSNTNIIPALWLSYHFLPPHLKRCFAFFSIFPKGYEFYAGERENIILMWMAEGLLQHQKGKRVEDVGEEYLNALITRSFFQQSYRWDESVLSMHDLMHDLAMCVAGEFCFPYGSRNDFHKLTSKTNYLSYWKEFEDNIESEDLSKAKYLGSLLALPLSICEYGESYRPILTEKVLNELLLRAGGGLRVLSISQSFIGELPDAIGKLKHLRYLDLSSTKISEIPSSICTLYNLQTLLLSDCTELTQLPTNISKLINLRHLVIRDTPLKELPPQMCSMTNIFK